MPPSAITCEGWWAAGRGDTVGVMTLPVYKANNRPRMKVGTRVGLGYGDYVQEAEVIEDCGDLGRNADQLVRVQYVMEGDLVTPPETVETYRLVSELVAPPAPGVDVELRAQRAPRARRRQRATA
jgi:hypothetical protein